MITLWILFYALVLVNFILLLFTVVTAGMHEIRYARSTKRLQQKSTRDFRPHITIFLPAHNEKAVIERCLASIHALDYPHYNVFVINDGSTDNTSRLAAKFIKRTGLNAKVIDIYPNLGKGGALNHVLQTYQAEIGSIFMVLDADCTIAPDGLRHMATQFLDPAVQAVNSNVRINSENSIMAWFQQIEYIVGYYHKRHNAYTNSEFIVGGQGAAYRTKTVLQVGGIKSNMQTEDIDLSMRIVALGNKQHRISYAPDVLIYTEAVPTIKSLYKQRYRWKFGAQQAIYANRSLVFSRQSKYSRLLTWFRLPQSIVGELRIFVDIIMLAVFVVTAILTQSLWIFLGAWLTVTIYTSFVLIADPISSWQTKFKLLSINTALFPLHIGMTLLNLIALLQGIANWQQLTGKQLASGSWVSPERIGKAQLG